MLGASLKSSRTLDGAFSFCRWRRRSHPIARITAMSSSGWSEEKTSLVMPHNKTRRKIPQSQLITEVYFCFRRSLWKWCCAFSSRTQVPKTSENGRFADLHFNPRGQVLSETKPQTEKKKGLPRKPCQRARSRANLPKAGRKWGFCGWRKFGDWVQKNEMAPTNALGSKSSLGGFRWTTFYCFILNNQLLFLIKCSCDIWRFTKR